jgi:hypothetical protein
MHRSIASARSAVVITLTLVLLAACCECAAVATRPAPPPPPKPTVKQMQHVAPASHKTCVETFDTTPGSTAYFDCVKSLKAIETK